MSYIGDFALESTFDHKFTTVSTAGVPTTLAGTPVISAYVGNSTTELTAGITLTVDFDSRTGMHNVRVVATAANGYATASNYQLVITTGTVGGSSVIGYVIGSFSIEARSALRPATAARTLVVDASGNGNANLVNIAGSAVSTSTAQLGVNAVQAGGTAWGSGAITAGSIAANAIADTKIATGAITSAKFAAGAINAAAIATDAITAAKIAADAIGASELAADAATEIGTAVWASATRVLTAGTNIALAKGTGVTGFNDLSAAQVNAEVDTALSDINLDHLVGTATGIPAIPAGTFFDQMLDDGTATFDRTTDSLQAIRDHVGDGTNLTEAGGTGDHLTAIATASALTTVDTVVDAIKAKTDSLTFTKALELDANIQSINGAEVVGDGNATPWDGA